MLHAEQKQHRPHNQKSGGGGGAVNAFAGAALGMRSADVAQARENLASRCGYPCHELPAHNFGFHR